MLVKIGVVLLLLWLVGVVGVYQIGKLVHVLLLAGGMLLLLGFARGRDEAMKSAAKTDASPRR